MRRLATCSAKDGFIITARIVDTERNYRDCWPTTAVFIIGKPREKKPDENPSLTPIDTSTTDLKKFNLSGGQCEGRNEPPGQ